MCVVVGLCGYCVWLWSCVGTVSGGCGPAVRWEGRNHPSSSPPALPQFTHENFSRKLREIFSTLLVLNCDTVSSSAICDEFLNYSHLCNICHSFSDKFIIFCHFLNCCCSCLMKKAPKRFQENMRRTRVHVSKYISTNCNSRRSRHWPCNMDFFSLELRSTQLA